MYNEDREERLALIAEGCKVSQHEAQTIYEQAQHVSETHYVDKVARLRELATLQRMGRHHKVSTKSKAAGQESER